MLSIGGFHPTSSPSSWCTGQMRKNSYGNQTLLLCKPWAIIRDCVVHQHDRLITWLKTTYSGSCLRVVVVCRISVGNGRKEGWLSGKTVAVDKMATLRNLNEIFHLNYLWMPSESPCFASFELQFSTSVYSSLLSQCLSSLTQSFFLCLSFCNLLHCLGINFTVIEGKAYFCCSCS